MMKRFRKYGIVCRLLGCLFIEGIWDRSLKEARVRLISVYTLCSAACILLSVTLATFLISKLFLMSGIAQSFTKSLLFILNSVLITRITLNFGCMVRGSSGLLQFLRDSQEYEKSTSFVLSEDSEIRWRRRGARVRKFASVMASLVTYALVIRVPVLTLVRGDEEWWRLCATTVNIFSTFVMIFYDCVLYIVLSCCSDVLADYVRAQVVTLRRKNSRMHPNQQTRREVEKVRLNVAAIKSLKRSINEIWHPALAFWAACLILIACITLYAIAAGDFWHPDVWITMVYSVHASLSFADIAILSQAISDEAQKLKEATVCVGMSGNAEGFREEVQYLHDTIDPESMCLTGAGFFSLNKTLLVSMAGSIITYSVILVQTGDELAEHVNVGSLVRQHA
ncbi:uncharacterized protein LOC144105304 [Amblyomma americanum]